MKITKKQISSFVKRYITPFIPAFLIVGFVVLHMLPIGDKSYIDICNNDARIRGLKQQIENENRIIEQLKQEINHSETDSVTIDRIAREKHGMQRPHEDVYIVVNSPDSITASHLSQ